LSASGWISWVERTLLLWVRSREINKGVGIETVHVLNDNFWRLGDFV
jgi:predicted ribosome-associated RNA-binding protein Tma20